MSEELCELGIVGLTSVGQQLAAFHASNKTRVCVGDEDPSFVPQVIKEYQAQTAADGEEEKPKSSKCMIPSNKMEELVVRLRQPRKIVVFGTHADDKKFEDTWNKLSPVLESGDTVIRWGKEENGTVQSSSSIVGNLSKLQAEPRGLHLLEMVRVERDRGVAFEGDNPEIFLVGGPKEGYEQLEPLLSPFASIGHVGNAAMCAHYAQMIQLAIENGIAQAFAEGTDILSKAAGYENPDIGRTMKKWNDEGGKLSSYLLRSLSKIHYKRDDISKKGFVVDHIFDSVDSNAADKWVTLEATKLGVPAPTVNASIEARFFS